VKAFWQSDAHAERYWAVDCRPNMKALEKDARVTWRMFFRCCLRQKISNADAWRKIPMR